MSRGELVPYVALLLCASLGVLFLAHGLLRFVRQSGHSTTAGMTIAKALDQTGLGDMLPASE